VSLAICRTFPPPVLTGSGSTGLQNASQPQGRPEVGWGLSRLRGKHKRPIAVETLDHGGRERGYGVLLFPKHYLDIVFPILREIIWLCHI